MIKIEAKTLEEAFEKASLQLKCSVTKLAVEVVQNPSKGVLGFFSKNAIIVATKKPEKKVVSATEKKVEPVQAKPNKPVEEKVVKTSEPLQKAVKKSVPKTEKKEPKPKKAPREKNFQSSSDEIIVPNSMVTAQDDYEDIVDENEYKSTDTVKKVSRSKDDVRKSIAQEEAQNESIKRVNTNKPKEDVVERFFETSLTQDEIVVEVRTQVNALFKSSCFSIDDIIVEMEDEKTILVEFNGEDSALLIGKEGYRYKALSYMLFNWINAKYGLQLRLEIAEFLKNQEEMIRKYLVGVAERVNNDGRAQTKVLDGVLVQIALKELREMFPDKYVAIRTNRDGFKYIIVNSFRNNG